MANTARGHIEQLPSGSFRVHVYAGTDPVTGRPRRLRETCPDAATAAATLGRLLNEADGGRFPDRAATLGQALDKYLEVTDLELSTREAHQGYIRRTIGPVLGDVKVRKLSADSLDSLYTALKKCSRLCGRLPKTEHRTAGPHVCDQRCGPLRDHRTNRPHTRDSRCPVHVCEPLTHPRIACSEYYKRTCVHSAVRVTCAGRSATVGVRACVLCVGPIDGFPSEASCEVPAVWHVHANQRGRPRGQALAELGYSGLRGGRAVSCVTQCRWRSGRVRLGGPAGRGRCPGRSRCVRRGLLGRPGPE